MKTLTLIVLRPPLMAAHGLLVLAEQAATGAPGYSPDAAAIARAAQDCRDREQALRLREALPNVPERSRAALLAEPIAQVETCGLALRFDPAQATAMIHLPRGACRTSLSFGGFGDPAAGLAGLAPLAGRSHPITHIAHTLIAALRQGGIGGDALAQIARYLDGAAGLVAVALADLETLRPAATRQAA